MTATLNNAVSAPRATGASVHRVWKLGDDIDTDVLAPGAYMKLGIDGIAPHCLESVRPEFATAVRPGDVVVAGANFGIGSSREQAAGALVHLGVRAVIAPSFSGLYFRNAFNLGLLLLTCPRAGEVRDGASVVLDLQALTVTTDAGVVLPCEPIPDFLLAMVAAGGLLNQLRLRMGVQGGKT
jgi:3-isopropylmalate/(R)-2-methylmalate dehydratase small subunit